MLSSNSLVNRTPHPVTLYVDDAPVLTIQPTSPTLRVPESSVEVGRVQLAAGVTIPLLAVRSEPFLEQRGTPGDGDHPLLIVAREVARAYPERRDFVFPHDFVRDSEGRILGCRALGRFA